MKRQIIIILISILFISCATNKHKKQGFVIEKSYNYEISFDYINDLIFIPVVIENKKYNFLFDTGAESNVIDPLVAKELNLKNLKKGTIANGTDSNKGVPIVEIKNITIGGLQFKETAGMIWDLSNLSNMVSCIKIDGIIGNNLMRKSNWQINYKDKKIKFSDNPNNFNISNSAKRIIMNAGRYGNVFFDININENIKKFTFDTGFNGFINTGVTEYLENQNYNTRIGLTGGNYTGKKEGELHYCYIESFKLNGFSYNCPSTISVIPNSSSLLGNEFYKNFTLTIDWKNDYLYLDPIKNIEFEEPIIFEISLNADFGKNEILIGNLIKDSKLLNEIDQNSKILSINEIDVSSFQKNELCEFWNNEMNNLKKQEKLNLIIENKGVPKKIIVNKIKNAW